MHICASDKPRTKTTQVITKQLAHNVHNNTTILAPVGGSKGLRWITLMAYCRPKIYKNNRYGPCRLTVLHKSWHTASFSLYMVHALRFHSTECLCLSWLAKLSCLVKFDQLWAEAMQDGRNDELYSLFNYKSNFPGPEIPSDEENTRTLFCEEATASASVLPGFTSSVSEATSAATLQIWPDLSSTSSRPDLALGFMFPALLLLKPLFFFFLFSARYGFRVYVSCTFSQAPLLLLLLGQIWP
ncbi:hypothetical protein Cni_G15771 [Canna indica]|uniref:Uncharacterized protein n=1 Tax=Canna indica TaxID=4628 RepID=A0AAQ3QF33_9LILI|nr:hypothetical protein Cni_G15771 [Canna indica]